MSARLIVHRRYAAEVRGAVVGRSDSSGEGARRDALEGTGEGALGRLVEKVADASFTVTDADVAAVREATGSDKGAFEIVMAASIGAGLKRWDMATRAIEGATDASS